MESKRKRRLHYAWMILAGCCVMQGASLGLINNCAGVFYAPVCGDLGFEMGEFSAYKMLYTLGAAAALPFVSKTFRKMDIRAVIGVAAAVYGGMAAAMGTFHELWQWYAAGVIQGMASSFVAMVPAPIILANWFHKKTGTAVGISAAFSGLMGMIGSSGLGMTIPLFGWRMSYLLVGGLSMALILPVALFVLRYRPEDLGMLPYGAESREEASRIEAPAEDREDRESRPEREKETARPSETSKGLGFFSFAHQPIFYVAMAAYACSMISGTLNSFLTPRGLAVGLSMTAAAMMTSLSLLGNMASKFILGKASDICGVIRVFLFSLLISGLGHVLLLGESQNSVIAGAFLYGITLPLSTVMLPLFCKIFWTGDAYAAAYAYISMIGTLVSAPCYMLFGLFYDWTGSYTLTISVSAAGILLMVFFVLIGGRSARPASSRA